MEDDQIKSVFGVIVAEAKAAGLPFLLIGGNAVVAHGYQRMTRDIDLLVKDSDRAAWHTTITQMGYAPHHLRDAFHMYNATTRGMPPLDLMFVDANTFAKLNDKYQSVTLEGVETNVPRLLYLLALKLHALKHYVPHRYERDLGDVVQLIKINSLSLADEEFQTILDRYATAQIRREIERRLAGPPPS